MLTKQCTLWAKLETTSGTDIVPDATYGIMAFDVDLSYKADMKERYPANSNRSAYPQVRGKTTMELKFWVELKGSGTQGTAPKYGPLLKACDRLEAIAGAPSSVTYTPAITSQTCTIYANIDGIQFKLVGCAGDAKIDLQSGDIPKLNFTMSGVYSALSTDVAIATTTYDTTTPSIVKATTTTFGNYAAIIDKINLKFGNTVAERVSMNAAEGVLAFMITDRKPTGMMSCEMVLMATVSANFLQYFHSGALAPKALSIILSTTSGNAITVSAPACILSAPKLTDKDGIRYTDIEFQCSRSAGNDEQSIVLT